MRIKTKTISAPARPMAKPSRSRSRPSSVGARTAKRPGQGKSPGALDTHTNASQTIMRPSEKAAIERRHWQG